MDTNLAINSVRSIWQTICQLSEPGAIYGPDDDRTLKQALVDLERALPEPVAEVEQIRRLLLGGVLKIPQGKQLKYPRS